LAPRAVSPLFTYTTLFRSTESHPDQAQDQGYVTGTHSGHGTNTVVQRAVCEKGTNPQNNKSGDEIRLIKLYHFTSPAFQRPWRVDRKSTRLNSSHVKISYA